MPNGTWIFLWIASSILQDTRCKLVYFRHEAHSYNIIYINLLYKIQCLTYNDKKYSISLSEMERQVRNKSKLINITYLSIISKQFLWSPNISGCYVVMYVFLAVNYLDHCFYYRNKLNPLLLNTCTNIFVILKIRKYTALDMVYIFSL